MTSAIGGLFGGGTVGSAESDLSSLIPQFENYASQAASLEPNFLNLGQQTQGEQQQIYGPAITQYQAGATGQVTPDQQTDIDNTLKQMNLATSGTYANLGLGGSTMENQDVNANTQKSLAQKQQFASLDETLGLSGLGMANTYNTQNLQDLIGALSTLTGAGSILGSATSALSGAGNLAAGQQATQLGLLGSLGKALGGGSSGYGGGGYSGSYSGGYSGAGTGGLV